MAVPVKPMIQVAKPYVKKAVKVVGKVALDKGAEFAKEKLEQYLKNQEEKKKAANETKA